MRAGDTNCLLRVWYGYNARCTKGKDCTFRHVRTPKTAKQKKVAKGRNCYHCGSDKHNSHDCKEKSLGKQKSKLKSNHVYVVRTGKDGKKMVADVTDDVACMIGSGDEDDSEEAAEEESGIHSRRKRQSSGAGGPAAKTSRIGALGKGKSFFAAIGFFMITLSTWNCNSTMRSSVDEPAVRSRYHARDNDECQLCARVCL